MNPRPVRVLILSTRYPPVYSGAALQVHDVLRRLGRQVVEGTVLTLRLPSLEKSAMLDGVRILRFGRGAGRVTRFLFAFQVFGYILLRGGHYDVVHSVSPGWATFLLPLACRMRGLSSLFTSSLMGSDDAFSLRDQSLGGLKSALMRRFDAITVYTKRQAEIFAEAGYRPGAIFELTCGVDDAVFVPGSDAACRRELRKTAGREDPGPVLLFIGTLVPRKGVALLVEAFARMLPRHPAAVLLLMGPKSRKEDYDMDESYVQGLQERCSRSDLAGHVLFLGRVDSSERKRAILQASDVLALFSEYEGLGIVILEAMACGVPPVLAPMPGVFDYVVRDGIDGRIAASRDPEVLAQALSDVLSSEEGREAMGRAARETVQRRFSMKLIASQYLELYRRLASAAAS